MKEPSDASEQLQSLSTLQSLKNEEKSSLKDTEPLFQPLNKPINELPKGIQGISSGVPGFAFITSYWKHKARERAWRDNPTDGIGTREKPLFKDKHPLCKDKTVLSLHVTKEIEEAARKWGDIAGLIFPVRHKFFNKVLSRLVKNNNVRQVVILGSGLDPRAVLKNGKHNKNEDYKGVKYYEIDFKEMLNYKEEIYKNNNIDKNAEFIGIDYTKEDFIKHLIDKGINLNEPTLFIWEGNTFYLDKKEVNDVLTKINQSFKQAWVACDYVTESDPKSEGDISTTQAQKINEEIEETTKRKTNKYTDFKKQVLEATGGYDVEEQTNYAELIEKYGVGAKGKFLRHAKNLL